MDKDDSYFFQYQFFLSISNRFPILAYIFVKWKTRHLRPYNNIYHTRWTINSKHTPIKKPKYNSREVHELGSSGMETNPRIYSSYHSLCIKKDGDVQNEYIHLSPFNIKAKAPSVLGPYIPHIIHYV